jgi:hypothetical protein
MAICETCPPAEVEMMISVLLNLFDTRGTLMTLLKHMIDREISHTGKLTSFTLETSRSNRLLQRTKPHYSVVILRVPDFSLLSRKCMAMHTSAALSFPLSRAWRHCHPAKATNWIPTNLTSGRRKLLKIWRMSSSSLLLSWRSSPPPSQRCPRAFALFLYLKEH